MSDQFHFNHYPLSLKSLPSGWALTPIQGFSEPPQPGFACGKHNRHGHGVVHLRPMNIDESGIISLNEIKSVSPDETLRVRDGDVLFNNTNSSAWVGKSAVIQNADDWAFSNHMTRLRLPSGIDGRFIAGQLHFLQQTGYFRHLCVNHVNQASVNSDVLGNAVPILLPPSAEQVRIADRIDELFTDLAAGTSALERVRKKLKRYRAAVLHAAVTGRLTAKWREAQRKKKTKLEPADEILKRILTARREAWEARTLAKYAEQGKPPPKNWRERYPQPVSINTDELAELPAGWCWASVDQLLSDGLCNGISVKGSDDPPGVPALKLSAMSEEGFDYSDIRYIPISSRVAADNEVIEGDFYVSRGNGSLRLLARGTLAQKPPHQIVFPDTMIRIRIGPVLSATRWIPTIWASSVVRRQIEKRAKTTAGIYKVSQEDLESIAVPLASEAEQEAVVEIVREKLSQIDALEIEIEHGLKRAGRLRQSILKSAFDGQLVPQDPSDEPAAALLARIRSEREQAAACEQARKQALKQAKKPAAKAKPAVTVKKTTSPVKSATKTRKTKSA